jgi:uncharacterized membrane protein YebE (DUF533 family)
MAGNQAHLDALAQKLGYRDYATYSAYQAHQAAMQQGPAPSAAPQPAQPQAPPQNWLQTLINNYTPLGGAMARIRKALP